jgi:hypothetical protein
MWLRSPAGASSNAHTVTRTADHRAPTEPWGFRTGSMSSVRRPNWALPGSSSSEGSRRCTRPWLFSCARPGRAHRRRHRCRRSCGRPSWRYRRWAGCLFSSMAPPSPSDGASARALQSASSGAPGSAPTPVVSTAVALPILPGSHPGRCCTVTAEPGYTSPLAWIFSSS